MSAFRIRSTVGPHASLFTILAFSLAGCNPTTTGPLGGEPGKYTAMVSGDVTVDLTGDATFSTTMDRNWVRHWSVMMATGRINEETSDLIVLFYRGSRGAPAPGTYVVRDDLEALTDATDFVAVYTHNRNPARSTAFKSITGSVTITESTRDTVAGTFTFDARRFAGEGEPLGQDVSVSGEFRATRSLWLLVSAPPTTRAPSTIRDAGRGRSACEGATPSAV